MLDSFEIITTSGVVLYSKSYASVNSNVVNSLIRDIFIEDRVPGGATKDELALPKPTYKKDGYTLKWTTAKEFGLIFVAVYQSLVHLGWIDKLLDNVRALFTGLYGDKLKQAHTSAVECPFDDYFERQVQELEARADGAPLEQPERTETIQYTPPSSSGTDTALEPPPPVPGLMNRPKKPLYSDNTSTDATPVPTPDTSRPSSPAVSQLLTGKSRPGGKLSRRDRRVKATASSAPVSSGDEAPNRRPQMGGRGSTKKNRVWGEFGAAEEDAGTTLDYSELVDDSAPVTSEPMREIEQDTWGKKTKTGEFVLKDLDEEMDAIIASANAKKESSDTSSSSGLIGSSLGTIGGLFRNVVGGKTLTKEDLVKPLKGMEEHLLKKNVAREAAVRLCESVERDLIGLRTPSFTSVEATLKSSMESAVRKILTPTTSMDILREIEAVRRPGSFSRATPRPYILSIVGVNGVGKSTNLSKIAFFLLHNHYRVLIVAADTFRSGAVEQLRVHVRNLQELSKREGGEVELFERGYGKDAANIAKDAVTYGAANNFDVVLIDTAGRRHNDQRLMSSLEKFAKLAQPDKILMVGEALVGTDSVAQARNFNASFGAGRRLDGFIISKCDTVGDMVGTLVSMVHATGIPVVFLGTGQHYGDLRTLNVGWATRLLMS